MKRVTAAIRRLFPVLVCLALLLPLLAVVGAPPALAAAADLGPADSGDRVSHLQRMLAAQGFYRGPIDGWYGARTRHAVVAFHKEIRAPRSAEWRSEDWELLARYDRPWLPSRSGEPDRLEINITAQVLYLIKNHAVEAIIPISSGNGEPYRNNSGALVRAHTPRGDFSLRWHVNGWRTSYLGQLYNPWYFYGGYAVHGSTSVPTYPASHGCVRVPMWESEYLDGQLFLGMPVHVWDAPAGTGPVFSEPDPAVYIPPFVDDEVHPHEWDIRVLARSGLTAGCAPYRFCPDEAVTRGQMAAFLSAALGGLPPGPDVFWDDNGSVFEPQINALAAAGVTAGCGEGRFCPNQAVTRGEMAGFLVAALGLSLEGRPNPFWDDNGTIFESQINALVGEGITAGCAADRFCPDRFVTRAQMATFLVKAFDL